MRKFARLCTRSYCGVAEVIQEYWRTYHGWPALLTSPYLHAAVVLTGVLWTRWTQPGWPDDVIAIVPSILGFSLGGYAMLLAFGDIKFIRVLTETEDDRTVSYFAALNASFVHFIVVQILAIVLALLGKAYLLEVSVLAMSVSFFCYMVFLYSIMAALAATFAVFRMASLYGRVARALREAQE
jgi:hypothetical protein